MQRLVQAVWAADRYFSGDPADDQQDSAAVTPLQQQRAAFFRATMSNDMQRQEIQQRLKAAERQFEAMKRRRTSRGLLRKQAELIVRLNDQLSATYATGVNIEARRADSLKQRQLTTNVELFNANLAVATEPQASVDPLRARRMIQTAEKRRVHDQMTKELMEDYQQSLDADDDEDYAAEDEDDSCSFEDRVNNLLGAADDSRQLEIHQKLLAPKMRTQSAAVGSSQSTIDADLERRLQRLQHR